MPGIGSLFVFEGPDGGGKSTLAKAFAAHLNDKNIPCDYLAFPGKEAGTLGLHVYELHHNWERFNIKSISPLSLQLLHIAAHIDTIENSVLPALKAGRCIALDRYWWSAWVYGLVAGIDAQILKSAIQIEKKYWGSVLPTNAFLIYRESPFNRNGFLEQWERLFATYRELAEKEKKHYSVLTIKNHGSVEEALENILKTVKLGKLYSDDTTKANLLQQTSRQKDINETFGEQLSLVFPDVNKKSIYQTKNPTVFIKLSPIETTEVFNTYWYFAAERQEVFFQRLAGNLPPWTEDRIISRYRFTNAYRASDRVSQYLIKNVIYKGCQSIEEVFFRILLFKLFNKIETWEILEQALGIISFADFKFDRYDEILTQALSQGETIYSAAYIMPSATGFGYKNKHSNHLKLLERMMEDEVPLRIAEMNSMSKVFELLRSYPMMGNFLAFQYTIDINYSEITNFSEMEFVVPGPGALDGIRKCFKGIAELSGSDIIRFMSEHQSEEFSRLNFQFKSLFGRPLQLIDCQNLFCEVDKYARIAHPDVKGISGRTRIKQSYYQKPGVISYWYPPKWGLNPLMTETL